MSWENNAYVVSKPSTKGFIPIEANGTVHTICTCGGQVLSRQSGYACVICGAELVINFANE